MQKLKSVSFGDCRKILQKHFDRIAPVEIIEQSLRWHPRPTENKRATKNLSVGLHWTMIECQHENQNATKAFAGKLKARLAPLRSRGSFMPPPAIHPALDGAGSTLASAGQNTMPPPPPSHWLATPPKYRPE